MGWRDKPRRVHWECWLCRAGPGAKWNWAMTGRHTLIRVTVPPLLPVIAAIERSQIWGQGSKVVQTWVWA